MAISDTTPVSAIPLTSLEMTSKPTWIVSGSEVKKCGVTIKENYTPSLDRLEVNGSFICISFFILLSLLCVKILALYLWEIWNGFMATEL